MLLHQFLVSRPQDMRAKISRIDALIDAEIRQSMWEVAEMNAPRERIADRRWVWTHVRRDYNMPAAVDSGDQILGALQSALGAEGAELRVLSQDRQCTVVSVTLADVETHRLRFIRTEEASTEVVATSLPASTEPGPRIAVIVDDLGYGGMATDLLLYLDEPLTVSVLPKLPGSEREARRAREAGFEVILHLPMEPEENDVPQPGELFAGMPHETIVRLVEENLATVPGAVGVNNHQGSKLTTLEGEMTAVMSAISEKALYFVDSLTTPDSVALDVARRLGVQCIGNDLFLDNEEDPERIRYRFDQLMRVARRRGFAVGICHAKMSTLEVLQHALPAVREEGCRLVRVSELLNEDAYHHAHAGN
jgi:polysaccharide deacetylase 2 family uncharacterized protein YibQ